MVKRLVSTIQRKAAAGVAVGAKRRRQVTEDELYGGELEDVWATPLEEPKRLHTYRNKFGKIDHNKVKAVINPSGG